ncbi:hypothetical protein F5X97DRAFT_252222 [Nemania serpens]|nr:hypothetical protein F5X97DRAFT_252222 [Nemania serpens]
MCTWRGHGHVFEVMWSFSPLLIFSLCLMLLRDACIFLCLVITCSRLARNDVVSVMALENLGSGSRLGERSQLAMQQLESCDVEPLSSSQA